MPPKVRVSDLRKRYGTTEAVRGVSFEIQDGEILGLLGPNGAGKTSTIECLLGLIPPDTGSIEICGIDARRHPMAARQRIGAALQTTALQDRITPREALRLFGSFYPQRVEPGLLLERFSLGQKADVAVDTLSGGQRQRLALALAFVNNPELVFLDEPTTGLDAHARRDLHDEIRKLRQDGHTVLLTTHQLDEAELLCDRIAIMSHGRIVATGSPRELVARSNRRQQLSFDTTAPIPHALAASLPDLRVLGDDRRRATLHTNAPGATLLTLVAALESHGVGLDELHVQRATLEDVFVDLTDTSTTEEPA